MVIKKFYLIIIVLLIIMLPALSQTTADDWNKKGVDLFAQGDYEGALDCFTKALEKNPKSPKLWYNKGKVYYTIGNYPKAIGCFNESIKYEPEFLPSWHLKGCSFSRLGRYEEAIECFDKILSINPEDKEAKTEKKNAEESLIVQSITPTPASTTIPTAIPTFIPTQVPTVISTPEPVDNKVSELLAKANTCYDEGKYDQAIAYYDSILAFDPGNTEAVAKKAKAELLLEQQVSISSTKIPLTPTPNIVSVPDGMVLIEGGTFEMGSNYYSDNAKPVHTVEVNSFYIGKYEVTNNQYKLFNPSLIRVFYGLDAPVAGISWYKAIDYCNWLSEQEGLDKSYVVDEDNVNWNKSANGYRLPTEAEWEYACRAGTTTKYYWGNEMNGDYCWYWDNSGGIPQLVGQKLPNAFGLYDMSGNVFEWCWDWYDKDYYQYCTIYSITNPEGPSSGSFRVYRGSYFGGNRFELISTERGRALPDACAYYCGFRIVRNAQ